MKRILSFLYITLLWQTGIQLQAQSSDSIFNHLISKVNYLDIVEVSQLERFRETIPTRVISQEEIKRYSPLSVADVLHFCAGVQVKDYGGIGGIKTINVRSMGSQHTGIFYDGIQLGNAQNGQIDLGQLSMENLREISVHQGQRSAIFQSATEFGHASTLYLHTRVPLFNKDEKHHLRLKLQGGSSGLQRVSAVWEQRINENISASFHVEELTASGKYKFRYKRLNYDGSVAYDTTATRHNGDLQSILAEANLYGKIHDGNWQLKGYSYQSKRGIPGAIVNNVWRGGERQSDNNLFVQGKYRRDITNRYSLLLQGKYAHYGTHYINNDSTRYLANNQYRQQEAWASASHVFSIVEGWDISAAYDFSWNHLHANLADFVSPQRFTNQFAIASAYNTHLFKLQASVLGSQITDKRAGEKRHFTQVSPALYLRYIPIRTLHSLPLSFHAFAKRCYRMPTFNDLYYTEIGNSYLRPERADIYDVGIQIEKKISQIHTLSLFSDIYYNHVADKIVAYPKGQQFRWTMLNLGRVDIQGLDLNLGYRYQNNQLALFANLQYTAQNAIDVTDSRDPYYRDQIPYVPHHSGSLALGATYKAFSVNYHFTYVGERWSQQENILYNHLEPWYTSDVNLQYSYRNYRFVAEVLNLLDQQYDVIANFPMPGRNFRFSLCVEL